MFLVSMHYTLISSFFNLMLYCYCLLT
jgi:hypothetical protein